MGITAGIIAYALSLDTTIRTNLDSGQDFPIEGYEFWESGMPRGGVLYIVNKTRLLADLPIWRKKTVLCTGWLEEEELRGQDLYWICVSDAISARDILHQIQKIFQRYYQWLIRLDTLVRKRESLSDLLDTLEEDFRLSGCISTQSMRLVGISDRFDRINSWVEGPDMVKLSMVNELVADEDFQDAAGKDGVFLYYNTRQEWYYCYNFKIDGKYQARLLVCTEDHRQAPGISNLVQDFAECLSDVYEDYFRQGGRIQDEQEIYEMICGMIRGVTVSVSDMRRLLSAYHWELAHEYQVLLFQFQEGASGGVGMAYYKAQIRKLFHDCYVVEERDRFICIRNLSRSKDDRKNYEQTLPYFLRETLCKAGISGVFRGFGKLHSYYLEAERALLVGERTDSTLWYYYFPRYVLPYMMEQCIQELSAEQVCHPALTVLSRYDRKKDTHLLESLRVFLREKQNITHTAELLEVHRTTLLVRLDRIRQLTGIDLDDYETCLHLMLSFEILDLEKEYYKI
jgi:hypothetical protein